METNMRVRTWMNGSPIHSFADECLCDDWCARGSRGRRTPRGRLASEKRDVQGWTSKRASRRVHNAARNAGDQAWRLRATPTKPQRREMRSMLQFVNLSCDFREFESRFSDMVRKNFVEDR